MSDANSRKMFVVMLDKPNYELTHIRDCATIEDARKEAREVARANAGSHGKGVVFQRLEAFQAEIVPVRETLEDAAAAEPGK